MDVSRLNLLVGTVTAVKQHEAADRCAFRVCIHTCVPRAGGGGGGGLAAPEEKALLVYVLLNLQQFDPWVATI